MRPSKVFLLIAAAGGAALLWQAETPGSETRRAALGANPKVMGYADDWATDLAASLRQIDRTTASWGAMLGRDLLRAGINLLSPSATPATPEAPRQAAPAQAAPADRNPDDFNKMIRELNKPGTQHVSLLPTRV
jgi:hypothetical protein